MDFVDIVLIRTHPTRLDSPPASASSNNFFPTSSYTLQHNDETSVTISHNVRMKDESAMPARNSWRAESSACSTHITRTPQSHSFLAHGLHEHLHPCCPGALESCGKLPFREWHFHPVQLYCFWWCEIGDARIFQRSCCCSPTLIRTLG